MREIQEHKIKIYEFPETGDEEENRLVRKIKVRCPPARHHLPFMMLGEKNALLLSQGQAAAGCSGKQHHY